MKKIIIVLIYILFFIPNIALAEIKFTTTFEEGYEYGNVKNCSFSGGAHYAKGEETVYNNSGESIVACLSARKNHALITFQCEDETMEQFTLNDVKGDDDVTYYGYGCRKPKDETQIEYIQGELYVGYGEQVAYETDNTCTIIEGNAGQFDKWNACYLNAVSPGTVKIKVVNNNTFATTYYEYTILSGTSDSSELDDDYLYGDVDKCVLSSDGYNLGGKVKFNDYTFCGSSLPGYDYESSQVSCVDSNYDAFQLTFVSNGQTYKGYGCRRIKELDNLDYIKKTINEDEIITLAEDAYNVCSVLEGNSVKIDGLNSCAFIGRYSGITRIKVVANKNGLPTFYEIEVISDKEAPTVDDPTLTPQTCDSLLGSPNPEEGEPKTPAYYLSLVFSIIRYVAIMVLIVLTIMDFVGAVASHDNDIMKKAVSKAAKRAILCVIIFLLPTLIDFILQFVHESSIKDCLEL